MISNKLILSSTTLFQFYKTTIYNICNWQSINAHNWFNKFWSIHKFWLQLQAYLWGQNGQIPLFLKIFCNQPLFGKCLAIYHFFETWFCELELHQNFFMILEFSSTMENSIFTKLSFKKCDRLLNISQTVVDPYIFFQIVVYDHFDPDQRMVMTQYTCRSYNTISLQRCTPSCLKL